MGEIPWDKLTWAAVMGVFLTAFLRRWIVHGSVQERNDELVKIIQQYAVSLDRLTELLRRSRPE